MSQNLSQIVTGRSESHLVAWPGTTLRVHEKVLAPLTHLAQRAAKAGFELGVVSAFRGFSDQLRIWNLKATGKRPVLDSAGKPVDIFSISSIELAHSIMRWSALPGASRHHWGTDLDLIDLKALPKDYKVQLVPEEVEGGGMFAPFHDWLDQEMTRDGFYRPYDRDRGGVSPERWHLSYYPLASTYDGKLTESLVLEAWKDQEIALENVLKKNLTEIFVKFVKNISPAPVNTD
jgi:LAS superfamily LD-carboxypeptidase LdcB